MKNMIKEKKEIKKESRVGPIFVSGIFMESKKRKLGPGIVPWVQALPTETKQKFEFAPDPLDYSEEPAENDDYEMAQRFPERNKEVYRTN